jgi:hypothetical protein
LEPSLRPPPAEEKQRYLQHNNDVEDPAYQKFVFPLVEAVRRRFPMPARGLDFGSGSGPVLSHLLRKEGHEIHQYDPYFCPHPEVFGLKYDFVVSCEVIEHLFDPRKEFETLAGLLKPGGMLGVMTLFWREEDVFDWYYARDPTHVGFFSDRNLKWLERHCGFREGRRESDRLALFYR